MGKTITPKYRLIIKDRTGETKTSWKGQATDDLLKSFVSDYIQSLKKGGSNHHITEELGFIPVPNTAAILLNDGSNQVVAEWKAPMFLAI